MLTTHYEETVGDYLLSTDKSRLDLAVIYQFLTESSTWARGITRPIVELSIANSLCFGLYRHDKLLAFCRIISDGATFGNLVDVFVIPEMRGCGLSKILLQCVMRHPLLLRLRRLTLATSNAHGLYQRFGFTALATPESFMEIHRPDIYCPLPALNK